MRKHRTQINVVDAEDDAIKLECRVGGTPVCAVLDTGAAVSCISAALSEELTKLTVVTFAPTTRRLELADSHTVATRRVTFSLTNGKLPFRLTPSPTLWICHGLSMNCLGRGSVS